MHTEYLQYLFLASEVRINQSDVKDKTTEPSQITIK